MAPKTMSSRLLTMKFMQRGIAASSSNSATTTPRAEDGHALKRRNVSQDSLDSRQSVSSTDGRAVQAAIEEEERKRQVAIAKQAADLGDTRWVLEFPSSSSPTPDKIPPAALDVVQIGFAQIDSAESDVAGPQMRRFNMKKFRSTQARNMETDSRSADSDSADEEPDDTRATRVSQSSAARGRQLVIEPSTRKRTKSETSSRSAERTKAQQLSAKRRKKEVKLNVPTSISCTNTSKTASRAGKGYH